MRSSIELKKQMAVLFAKDIQYCGWTVFQGFSHVQIPVPSLAEQECPAEAEREARKKQYATEDPDL